jgi:lipoprotein-anchoring transpeptidase ErfK/SrfK
VHRPVPDSRRPRARRSAAAGLAAALLSAGALQAQSNPPALSLETVRLQVALDRNGFGVGLIDGREGARTEGAFADYRRARGLSWAAARDALLAEPNPLTLYAVTQADLARIGSAPADWVAAAQVPAMAYESLPELLAEKFHVKPACLEALNPATHAWDAALAGARIAVPNVARPGPPASAAALEIDCRHFRLRALDTNGDILASFPCSVATDLTRVPTGELRVVDFAPNPNYTFDPANFPESPRAQEIGRKLIIPPGPNTPVGVYWMSLSAPGFGIHGTNRPETIGRRESHGCFRLTNWDIVVLARMVAAGTPVRVVGIDPPNP